MYNMQCTLYTVYSVYNCIQYTVYKCLHKAYTTYVDPGMNEAGPRRNPASRTATEDGTQLVHVEVSIGRSVPIVRQVGAVRLHRFRGVVSGACRRRRKLITGWADRSIYICVSNMSIHIYIYIYIYMLMVILYYILNIYENIMIL